MKITNQRLRNLTTERLHTNIADIYEDLMAIVGGFFLPISISAVHTSVLKWLKTLDLDPKFWEDEFDPDHVRETELPEPSQDQREQTIHEAITLLSQTLQTYTPLSASPPPLRKLKAWPVHQRTEMILLC